MRSELSDVLDALEPSTVCDTIGEYQITSKLGEGGMGTVYGAVHRVIGKRVAIKVMRSDLGANADAVDRFVREAQAINRIGHPNIVDVFGFGTLPDGRHYYVMAHLAGQTLGDRMCTPMALGECVVVVDQIARALEAAHEAGVVHRDLKPENVFLAEVRGEPPRATLLDFGIAKLTDDAIDRTAAGMMVGTPLYASPEQARGVRVDARSDIYTLGVMMFEMMAGTLPFVATSSHELLAQHVGEQAPRASEHHAGIPRAIDDLLAAMLAKDPDARPSLATVRTLLASFASDSSQPITWAPRAVARVRARGSVAPATLPLTPSVRAAPPIEDASIVIVDSGVLVSRLLPVPRAPTRDSGPARVVTPASRSSRGVAGVLAVIGFAACVAWWLASAPPSPATSSDTRRPAPSLTTSSGTPTIAPARAEGSIPPSLVTTSDATPTIAPATVPSRSERSLMTAPSDAPTIAPHPVPRERRTKRSTSSSRSEPSRSRDRVPAQPTPPPGATQSKKLAPTAAQVRDPFASGVHDPFATP